jgi:RND superfamily putative drug exporter
LLGWIGIFLIVSTTTPPWNSVATDGELRHLPSRMPTRIGARLQEQAFPDEVTDSSVVIVLHRAESPLKPEDAEFIRGPLVQGLEAIAEQYGGLVGPPSHLKMIPHAIREMAEAIASHGVELPPSLQPLTRPPNRDLQHDGGDPRIVSISSMDDFATGLMLLSADGHATLVTIGLTSGFLVTQNQAIIEDIESLLTRLRSQDQVPAGLRIDLSGSATVGAGSIRAVSDSTKAVRRWAIWITLVLLFVVFRAPIAALIPLATMYVAVEVTLAVLTWAAYHEVLPVFDGLKLYVTVIVYGAGVDYSLFLLARCEEELRDGRTVSASVYQSIKNVGTAIAASAGTEIVGIGLLTTAEFGKFRQAGVGITLGLAILLVASLTLTPAILFITREWTFWPQPLIRPAPRQRFSIDWLSERIWRSIGGIQRRYPATMLLIAVGLMTPMALMGTAYLDNLNYGLLAGLPDECPSVKGTETLGKHFEPGETGPITLLLRHDDLDFSSHHGIRLVADLTDQLHQQSKQLQIADIRSLSDPLGRGDRVQQVIARLAALFPIPTFLDRGQIVVTDTEGMTLGEMILQETLRAWAYEQYVSHATSYDGTVTRLTLIPQGDPFGPGSIQQIDALEQAIQESLPEELTGSQFYLLGATAGLRDVRDVARSDWARIRVVIPVGVFLVLLLLLRRPLVSAYLVATVIFSFLVTYGVTVGVFRAFDPPGFHGLDWTVPILLFTLLVAVGEDYSVLLVTRTEEERRDHTPTRGTTEALVKTGGLISGAGLIMAGTFSALAFGGTMAGMHQLGFALCFGMLLDTFVVRPLLVPSFLDLLARWRMRRRLRFGRARSDHEE